MFPFSELSPPSSTINEIPLAEIEKDAQKKEKLFARHLVDENLGEIERAIYILKNGTNIQKYSIYESLPSLFQKHKQKAIVPIIKLLFDIIWHEDEDSQIMAGDYLVPCFPFFSEENLKEILDLIQSMINTGESVAAVWQDVLILGVEHFPLDLLENEVLPLALQKTSPSEIETNRIFSVRLIGSISKKFKPNFIKQTYLQKIIDLCQDASYNVRKTMAEEIINISKGIGQDKTKLYLVDELLRLTTDDMKYVRKSAFESLTTLLGTFDERYRVDYLQSYFVNWIKKPPSDLYSTIVERFGEIFYYLQIKDDDLVNTFVQFYVNASKDNSQNIRENCAFNLPGVIKCIGPRRYERCLHTTLCNFCQDPCLSIRKRVASGFHEIVKVLLEDGISKVLKQQFFTLIGDNNIEVRDKIINNLSCLLQSFKQCLAKSSDSFFSTALTFIVKHHSTIKNSWRRLDTFYSHLQNFPKYFTKEQILEHFIPIVKNQLLDSASAIPSKIQAASCLIILVRSIQNLGKQKEIISSVVKDLSNNKSYWHRMTLVDLTLCVLEHFSKKFSKEVVFEHVLKLAKDKVPNVRRKVCLIIPDLKQTLQLPDDVLMLAKIKERISFLSLDKDRDVKEAASNAKGVLQTIETETSRGYRLNLQTNDELDDKRKEKEESEWLEKEVVIPIPTIVATVVTTKKEPTSLTSKTGKTGSSNSIPLPNKRERLTPQPTKPTKPKVAGGKTVKTKSSSNIISSKAK
ncbi:hypothetical protein ABK040_013871 [Willaertia magna]